MASSLGINQEIINILNQIKSKISDESDMAWTQYESAKELRTKIELFSQELWNGDRSYMEQIKTLFLPTGTFQEHSISNCWSKEYIALAEQFDHLYSIAQHT